MKAITLQESLKIRKNYPKVQSMYRGAEKGYLSTLNFKSEVLEYFQSGVEKRNQLLAKNVKKYQSLNNQRQAKGVENTGEALMGCFVYLPILIVIMGACLLVLGFGVMWLLTGIGVLLGF